MKKMWTIKKGLKIMWTQKKIYIQMTQTHSGLKPAFANN